MLVIHTCDTYCFAHPQETLDPPKPCRFFEVTALPQSACEVYIKIKSMKSSMHAFMKAEDTAATGPAVAP